MRTHAPTAAKRAGDILASAFTGGIEMIVFKLWKATRRTKAYKPDDVWLRKGWFLFGIIPLYVADIENREKF
jgi:hypothetical protein